MSISLVINIYKYCFFIGDYVVNEDMVKDSGKLAVLDIMLTRLIKDGHKVNIGVIFK
jgi:hypothetical protein